MSQGILKHAEPHPVHVRMDREADQIDTVSLMVVPRSDDLEEIDADRHVLGYIHQAGRVFVALAGERLDRAEECGQSLLWDKAAADLVRRARLDGASCSQCASETICDEDADGATPLSRDSVSTHP
jgi:hypothetical protein